MTKALDLSRSVYELVKDYPEVADILANLGFTEIRKKAVLSSMGKLMTIPRGAKMKGIPMEKVVLAFIENGFELSGPMPKSVQPDPADAKLADERTELLKGYLRRLAQGESLEAVRADFVKSFKDVDASEVMQAEQQMIAEGMPVTEVQKLCDVHSALFHGSIAEAETAAMSAMDRKAKAESLVNRCGHPLQTLTFENDALKILLDEAKSADDMLSILTRIREIAIHYAKKGDLLYPHLKVRYGISGPSDVMWSVDDEIRDELSALVKNPTLDEAWSSRVKDVLSRVDEMIYKETNILFPICAQNFTEEEWMGIYRDSKDYARCLGVHGLVWDEAEGQGLPASQSQEGKVILPGGHMTLEQLRAVLNTIPMEISFVDDNDINCFFNEGPKDFKRPGMAVGRKVFSCHPPKIEPMVRAIINDFRTGKRDSVPVWMEKNGKTMLVKYMAVRDHDGKYLGTMELVQNMEFAKEHFANQ